MMTGEESNALVSFEGAMTRAERCLNEARQLGQMMGRKMVEFGAELNEAKRLAPHGQWMGEVESRFGMSRSQASKYMKIAAENPHWLRGSNVASTLHLGIETVYQLIQHPAAAEAIAQKVEAGEPVTEKEARATIKDVKAAVAKAREEEQAKARAEIEAKVKERYEADAERLAKQREVELRNEKRIEFLQNRAAELEEDTGRRVRQNGYLMKAKAALKSFAVETQDVLNGEEGPVVDPAAWLKLADDLESSAAWIRGKLEGNGHEIL